MSSHQACCICVCSFSTTSPSPIRSWVTLMPVIAVKAGARTFDSYSCVVMVSETTLISMPAKGFAASMNHCISASCVARPCSITRRRRRRDPQGASRARRTKTFAARQPGNAFGRRGTQGAGACPRTRRGAGHSAARRTDQPSRSRRRSNGSRRRYRSFAAPSFCISHDRRLSAHAFDSPVAAWFDRRRSCRSRRGPFAAFDQWSRPESRRGRNRRTQARPADRAGDAMVARRHFGAAHPQPGAAAAVARDARRPRGARRPDGPCRACRRKRRGIGIACRRGERHIEELAATGRQRARCRA